MGQDSRQRELVEQFRRRFEQRYAADSRFVAAPQREDRPDGSTLASRFAVSDKLWLEMAIRPAVPQLRAGILTDDRWTSEDLEDAIESSGDTMTEYVELGFEEAGLTWPAPTVEHYRDQGKYFYFATALDLSAIDQLSDEAVFDRICRMFEGYYEAFRTPIRKALAGASSR